MKKYKRMFAFFLALLLGIGSMSLRIPVNAVSLGKEIETADVNDNTELANPKKPQSADDAWQGSYVNFGAWQGKPLKWRILNNNGTDLLLMTDESVGSYPYRHVDTYTIEDSDNTWEKSTLRSWLNKEFINNAFTSDEQNALKINTVLNGNTASDLFDSGPTTRDKVFILSSAEFRNENYGFWNEYENCRSRVFGKNSAEMVWTRTMVGKAGVNSDIGFYAHWINQKGGFSARGSWFTHAVTWDKDVHPVIKIPVAAIDEEWEGFSGKNTKSTVLTIYENVEKPDSLTSRYILSEGADVDNGRHVVRTPVDGCATVTGEWNQVVVSKENYSTRTLTKKRLEKTKKIHLQPKSDNPVINGVWLDEVSPNGESDIDILNEEYVVGITENKKIKLEAEIDWESGWVGNGDCEKIELVQDGRKEEFTGNTLEIVLKDKFNVSDPIYIRATNNVGGVTVKKLLFLPDSSIPDDLDGLKFSFGKSMSLDIPDELPFVGGGKIELDLSSGTVPITYTIEDNKVKGVIGIDILKIKDKEEEKKTKKWLFENVKSINESIKELRENICNWKKDFKEAIAKPEGKYVFEANYTVLGYFEGYIEDFEFKWLDGGVVLNPSISYGRSGQFLLGPSLIPCYWEWKIKAEIEAKMNLFREKNAKTFLPAGKFGGTLTGNVGGGVGINKLVTVGGGGKLTLKPSVEFSEIDYYFKMSAKLSAYFKTKFLFLEYEKDIAETEWIAEYPKVTTSNKTITEMTDLGFCDSEKYSFQDLRYLNKGSKFKANLDVHAIREKRNSVKNYTSNVFKTNTYSETSPKLASFSDGSKLAVWIDSNSADINAINLYYSYFNGNIWSAPAVIENDGTVDFTPDLAVVDDTVYIIWQNGRKEFSDQDTLETIASNMGITAAVFDRNNQTFQCKDLTETVNGLSMQPKLCGKNGEISAVWLNNKANDWFGMNEENAIMGCKFDGAEWQNPEIYYDSRKSINSFSVDYVDDKLHIAFCEDSDNNPDTINDLKIYLNGNPVSAGSSPVLDNGTLYWYEDGKIMCQGVNSNQEKIVVDSDIVDTDRFQIISNDLHRVILFTVSDGVQNELYAVYQDIETGMRGNPVALTEEGGFISDYSGIWNGNELEILANQIAVVGDYDSGDPYGETCLKRITVSLVPDISVDEVILDESKIVPGEDIEIRVQVTNTGKVAGQCKINICNANGEVVNSELMTDKFLPGCTQEISCNYHVPADAIGKNITVEALLVNSDGSTLADDKPKVMMDYQDIALENTGWGLTSDNSVYIYTTVTNWGYQDASAVKVCLYDNSAQRSMIDSVVLDNVETLDVKKVSFHVPYEKDKVYYVEVADIENDGMVGNNKDFVVLDEALYTRTQEEGLFSNKIQRITLSVTDASLNAGNILQLSAEIFPEDAENKALKWTSSDEQVAIVDNNGLVTAVGTGKATITVESQDGSGISASCVVTVTKLSDDHPGGNNPSGGSSGSYPSGGYPSGGSPSDSTMPGEKPGNAPDESTGNNNGNDLQVNLLYYIVKFDSNGGTGLSRKTMTLLMDDTLGILPKVNQKNYIFKGWYTQKSGGEKVKQSTILNASTTLYAQWSKIAKPAKVKKLALKSAKSGQMKVSFQKVTGAAGYQIVYSTNKKFASSVTKKVITVSGEQTFKKLKTGRKYYVRVRAYKTGSMGEKIYGSYSNIKTISIK